jgi:cytochrome P450
MDSAEVYYDPYDFEIDDDPYPVFRRLRDEAPLYRNDKHDFYALSRFDDVQRCSVDWGTYISGRGSVLELIKANFDIPAGVILFEDPPMHDVHRGVLRRAFTPRRMAQLEDKVRAFCAACLDPFVGSGGFDFIADLGAQMPMRTIGMLLGIPESQQEAIRDHVDAGMKLNSEGPRPRDVGEALNVSHLTDYVKWRADNPADDLVTELLTAELTDETGPGRTLSLDVVTNFVALLAGAGNETTTRLIGWTGKVLAENPDQRAELAADLSLIPAAIEELLRYESPSPVQARYVTRDVEHYGTTVPEGSVLLLLTASANRDERKYAEPDHFDIHRRTDGHVAFGYGIHFCLGAALARLEGRIALEEVLKRFPTWEVDTDRAVRARTSTVRGWESLPVVAPSGAPV